jgi:hypothetical protein
LRAFVFATLFVITIAGPALADESVAGNWRANMGQGVAIGMNVTPDGNWSSETYQHGKVVRQMRGTYEQKRNNDRSGVLVFTPTEASSQGGKAQVETDRYQIAGNGNQLNLTSGGDTMVFHRQAQH